MEGEELTGVVLGAAIMVHSELGPGMLESAYEACLAHALEKRGHRVERQVEVPVLFQGMRVDAAYRMDLVVDRKVVVEIKAVEALLPVHEAQLLTYLRFSGHRFGLLLNFHTRLLKEGIRRMILG